MKGDGIKDQSRSSNEWRTERKMPRNISRETSRTKNTAGAPSPETPVLRPRGVRRRRLMLDTALRLFREKGMDGVTLAEVVRLSGGSLASAYKFFGSKEGLFLAVFERTIADVARRCAKIEVHGADFGQRLGSFVRAILEMKVERSARLFLSEGIKIELFRNRVLPTFEKSVLPIFTSKLEEIAAASSVRFRFPAADVALVLIRLLRGTIVEAVCAPDFYADRPDRDTLLTVTAISSFLEPIPSAGRRTSSVPHGGMK